MKATRQELIDFLDSIRDYERESHNLIGFDERESGEFVDQYLSSHPQGEWIRVEDGTPLETDFEVVGFNINWIDPDFNPKGTRVCFYTDHGWIIARWNAIHDCYITDTEDDEMYESPTHWMPFPKPPKETKP